MFSLKGKKALVTGSSQGIGFAIAKCFSEYGATVFVHGATNIEKCRKASEQISNSIPVCQNFSDDCAAEKLYEMTGDVDIVICNASIQIRKAWSEIDYEQFDLQMLINLKTTMRLFQLYSKNMIEKECGRLIAVGSVQQYKPHKDMMVYAASKAAQMNMVRNLASQLAPFGITVNNLCPGVIETPRNYKALADEKYAEQVILGIPMGYVGEATDCVGAALLLASDAGRYITGIDLVVDGGKSL